MTQQMTPAAAHRVTHADFTIERVYDAAPARVYAAFADAETKQRWSFCHSDWPVEPALNFRPGGRETIRSEEHTSALPSLMRISYAVFCLQKQQTTQRTKSHK